MAKAFKKVGNAMEVSEVVDVKQLFSRQELLDLKANTQAIIDQANASIVKANAALTELDAFILEADNLGI